jgi:hypothetical protein
MIAARMTLQPLPAGTIGSGLAPPLAGATEGSPEAVALVRAPEGNGEGERDRFAAPDAVALGVPVAVGAPEGEAEGTMLVPGQMPGTVSWANLPAFTNAWYASLLGSTSNMMWLSLPTPSRNHSVDSAMRTAERATW